MKGIETNELPESLKLTFSEIIVFLPQKGVNIKAVLPMKHFA